jgi:hypothetical protein
LHAEIVELSVEGRQPAGIDQLPAFPTRKAELREPAEIAFADLTDDRMVRHPDQVLAAGPLHCGRPCADAVPVGQVDVIVVYKVDRL